MQAAFPPEGSVVNRYSVKFGGGAGLQYRVRALPIAWGTRSMPHRYSAADYGKTF